MTKTKNKPNRWDELNRANDAVLIEWLPLRLKRSIYSLMVNQNRTAAHVKGMVFAMLGQPRRNESGHQTYLAVCAYVEAVAAGREGPPPAA